MALFEGYERRIDTINATLERHRLASLDEARAWAAADPYAKAGLFQSVAIREWKKVIG